ncbi:MAG: hypothetical protein AMJ90_05645 [candidate division Zixibacteria bacterium SM23_73_2]|nr:MAG: hypothetical protein AMJ90_05645 [candidate division Zixibacteria bacterium SM23_73_2]
MASAGLIGTWLAAGLTLCIFSFLYRDNPFYKFAEHLYVGVSAGYWACLEYHNVFRPNLWDPLVRGDLILLIPFALGLLLFSRFTNKLFWLSRWAMALIIGIFAGIAIIGYGTGDLILQIHANLLPLWTGNWLESMNNFLLTIGVITGLIYFFFSKEHKGAVGSGARIGIWFLMISFGASFGYTVMSRMSLLIGRVYFLLGEWLHLIQ